MKFFRCSLSKAALKIVIAASAVSAPAAAFAQSCDATIDDQIAHQTDRVERGIVAFVDVNVLPMDVERVLDRQTVIVTDGIITAMGAVDAILVPDTAYVVHGNGRYLLPGLSDMHGHIPAFRGEGDADKIRQVAANLLLMYAASGVTLVRDPNGSDIHAEYNRKLASGEFVGPRLYYTSPILEGSEAVSGSSRRLTDPGEVDGLISQYKTDGYWGVKVYHTLSREVYDAVIAAGRKYDIPVIGHVPFEVGIDAALQSGQYSIEHLRGYDFDGIAAVDLKADGGRSARRFGSWLTMTDRRMDELVYKTLESGAWNTPTLAINRFLFDADSRAAQASEPRFTRAHPALREKVVKANSIDKYFSVASREALRNAMPRMMEMIRRLNASGAGLLVGTDAAISAYVPGFTSIDEVQSFAAAGISNFDALKAATTNGAVSLGLEKQLGSVAVGKEADLVIIEGNPLDDLAALWQLYGVMLRGQWYTAAELEARLDQMAQ